MNHALVVNSNDNVANALDDIPAGEQFAFSVGKDSYTLTAIKVAIKKIQKGEQIIKYGCVIGVASQDIEPGQSVHIHNVEGTRGRGDKKGD